MTIEVRPEVNVGHWQSDTEGQVLGCVIRVSRKSAGSLKIYLENKKPRELIHLLNHYNKNKKNIWMLHPGHAGTEVYQKLAGLLDNYYNCYAIDNYNYYNENSPINELKPLAEMYLKNIQDHSHYTCDEVTLLGWSLGGTIALEIAAALEKQGIKNIKVYSLDTIIVDEYLKNLNTQIESMIPLDERIKIRSKEMEKQGYDSEYIKKINTLVPIEEKISKQSLSAKLNKTKVILYKASQVKNSLNEIEQKYMQYIELLHANNVDKICQWLQIIHLQCHHYNILELYDSYIANDLIREILKQEYCDNFAA